MLSMIDFSPLLVTHAFNDSGSRATFLLSNFPHPLATHAFNDSGSSTTFLLSKFSPPLPLLATHAFNDSGSRTTFLCDPTWQHSFYQIFPPLGNPCFQWFKFKYNIPFIKIFPPLGNPCFATLPDNIPFIKIYPPWQPMLSMIQVQVQHSFYQKISPPLGIPCFATLPDNIPFIKFSPPWQPMLSMIRVQVQHSIYQFFPPPLATHALRPYLTTFLLSNFSPPWQPMLCDPTWQHSFYQILPPLATHAFNDSSSSTTFLLSKKIHPPWQPMLCDPTWQHSFYQNFPPLGNPCFQWFKFKYNIPFIKIFLPLATHALRPYLTTFLLSNFPPPWQPMLSMIQVQVQHSFYQKIPPPPWQPMLCDPTWQHSFYQNFPPLATHAFNDSSSSITFLLSKFSPPLATHALRLYLTTFLLSNFPPPWQPMLSMIQVQVQHSFYQKNSPPPWQPMLCDPTWQHSFYQNFPPLETHAFNSSSSSTTFLLSKIPPPPWQPMLCDPTWQHSFYQIFPPLGNPCFQWFNFKYNIPFIHIASKYANAPLRHAVKEPPETSQHHAKTSSHTLLRPYPTTFSNQQRRTEVGSHNTPYSHT